MPTRDDIVKFTNEFFDLFWNLNLGARPEWSRCVPFTFGGARPQNKDIPSENMPGCYAFLHGDKVIYIGVGVKGMSPYLFSGIGIRIKARHDTYRREKKPDWAGRVTDLCTIAFPRDDERLPQFLAYALEQYLIWKCEPCEN